MPAIPRRIVRHQGADGPGAGDRDEAGGVLRRAGVEKRLSWTTPSALDSPLSTITGVLSSIGF